MNCENCGALLPEDTTLCPVCGAENADTVTPATAVIVEVQEALNEAAQALENVVQPEEPESQPEPVPQPEPEPQTESMPEAEPCDECDENAPAEAPEEPEQPQGRVNIVTPIYARAPEEYFAPGAARPEAKPQPAQPAEVPGPLDYFLMQLITGLPLIGLIVSIVWATDREVTHRKNYALGNLLYKLVLLVVWLLAAAIVLSLLNLILSQFITYSPTLGGMNGFGSFFY